MFENYIKSVYDGIIKNIGFSSKYISVSELLDNNIDDYYRQFLNADVDFLIYKDKLERFSNPNFNFSDKEFKSKIDELDNYYRANAKYAKYQVHDLIKSAVEIRLNVLIRPLHSLVWFIYKDELTKPLNEVMLKLNYLSDYNYIINQIKEDLTEDNIDNDATVLISSAEFKHRIVNIDLQFISKSSIDDLINNLDPIIKFFGLSNEKGEAVIPAEALIIFIDDKGFKPLAGFLEKKYMQINDATISKAEIKAIFSKLEESYNKYQDDDILNSSVNGFEEQINTFGDDELAGINEEDDNSAAISNADVYDKNIDEDELVDLNDEIEKDSMTNLPEETEHTKEDSSAENNTFKDQLKVYLNEYKII